VRCKDINSGACAQQMDCLPWLAKLYPTRVAAQGAAPAPAPESLETRIANEMEAQLAEIEAEPIFCCDATSDTSSASDASCASGQLYWEQLRNETF